MQLLGTYCTCETEPLDCLLDTRARLPEDWPESCIASECALCFPCSRGA
jgi:hypothetical protein